MPQPVATRATLYPSESSRVMSVIIRLGEILVRQNVLTEEALELALPGLVNDAHAAPAQFADDLVTGHGNLGGGAVGG